MTTRRSTMEPIFSRIRSLIGDPNQAGTSPQFVDEQIQEVCDEHRDDVNYLELDPVETLGTTPQWFTYVAPFGAWEADVQLVQPGSTYVVVTPDTSDLLIGRFTFDESITPPVMIRGRVYDVHAIAADLLDQWANALASNTMDFKTGTKQFQRSQLVANLERRAIAERAKSRPTVVHMSRSDMAASRDYQSDDQRWAWRRIG